MPDGGSWTLELFLERLDLWEDQEDPPPDLLIIVASWIQSRMDDPFENAERVDGFEELWFAVVPNSHDGGRVVTCTYWIYPAQRIVQCSYFGTLSLPI